MRRRRENFKNIIITIVLRKEAIALLFMIGRFIDTKLVIVVVDANAIFSDTHSSELLVHEYRIQLVTINCNMRRH